MGCVEATIWVHKSAKIIKIWQKWDSWCTFE